MILLKKKSGFTLIELLVVIAIIGILAGLVIINLNSARVKARDAKRKSDLASIQMAVESYIDDKGLPPPDRQAPGSADSSLNSDFLQPLLDEGYLTTAPRDPINQGFYQYLYFEDGTLYYVRAKLEKQTCGEHLWYVGDPDWSPVFVLTSVPASRMDTWWDPLPCS